MLILFMRTAILYIFVVLTMRVMGKRQIGQLEPFELVIAILIADLAAVPMEDKDIPLLHGILPIFLLLFFQVFFSYLSLKSIRFRRLFDGTPDILIRNGRIDEEAMYQSRYTLEELLGQLRTKGYVNPSDIEYAVLETNGDVSVIPKSQKRPVNPSDLGIPTAYEGLPTPLILDGHLVKENLRSVGLSVSWLKKELARAGVGETKEVFLALLDTQGELYVQTKDSSTTP